MELEPNRTSRALFQSLVHGPLLVEALPEADTLPRSSLVFPESFPKLNLEQKLGHLYEDALAVLIEASPEFELLEQNLQIQKDAHTTVGELDFLLRERDSGQLIHLELATKFYLAVNTVDGMSLPGPDARDNYHRKLKRLREHQLQLSILHRPHLPECYRDEAILTKQLIYGCLFDHIHAVEPAAPEFTNPHCRRGRWLHQHECVDHFQHGSKLQIIPKPLWPVPLAFLKDMRLDAWSWDLPVERCVMVRLDDDDTPYFIAPDGYPRS